MLAAYLYRAYQFRKKDPVKQILDEAPAATCAAYQTELKRLRDFSVTSRLTVPFIPGPVIFVIGFLIPELGLVKAVWLTTALIASPFLVAIPLLRRKQRILKCEIDSLDALMK